VNSQDKSRSETKIAFVLLAFILLLAIVGIGMMVFQEQERLRLITEYRVFQLATELQALYDRNNTQAIENFPNVLGFGIYTVTGTVLYQYGNAPFTIDPDETLRTPRIEKDVLYLVRSFGGMGAMRNRMENMFSEIPGTNSQRQTRPLGTARSGAERLIFIAYKIPRFQSSLIIMYGIALLLVIALVGIFALLIRLAKHLDAYRKNEARNQELVALGEAARTLSHEIKNPLGVLRIQTALLKKQLENPEASANIKIIDEEIERITMLTNKVRQFLSDDRSNVHVFSISEYLTEFVRRYGQMVQIKGLPPDTISITFDKEQLSQVLDNLVSNAFESMEGLPFVPVELSCRVLRNSIVQITITDKGKGIPKNCSERIYDLFFTTKSNGSGLGLAIARRYVNLANGRLYHQPGEGGGTVFILELPITTLLQTTKKE
jgi:signal transduction histidine kinase